MTESALLREIMLAVSQTGGRVFRNNVAKGWIGEGTCHRDMSGMAVTIRNPRRLHAGLCVGSSDLIGFTADGKFLAIECKAGRGKATPMQQNFIDAVNRAGGIGIIARSVQDVLTALAP